MRPALSGSPGYLELGADNLRVSSAVPIVQALQGMRVGFVSFFKLCVSVPHFFIS